MKRTMGWMVTVLLLVSSLSALAQDEKGGAAKDAPAKPAPAAKAEAKKVEKKPAAEAKAADAKATGAAAATAAAAAAGTEAVDADAAAEAASADMIGLASLGLMVGDTDVIGYGDLLAPLWFDESSVVFFNPRFSATDHSEQELNLGVGYRRLMDHKGSQYILGGNAYYDTRWTAYDNRFDQLGLGIEFMSKLIDARANWYLVDDKQKLADQQEEITSTSGTSSGYEDPYGEGNAVKQDFVATTSTTTTRKLFKQYEAALEGWDAELGLLLPYLDQYAATRLFVGYQSFKNPFGDDYKGPKGRLEIRTLPGLTLDAEVFDQKELNGTDYYVGGRLHVPFDTYSLAEGKNPFAGTGEYFKRSQEQVFANRLTEMVIRDVKIHTMLSDYIEDMNERQITTTKSSEVTELILLDGIAFVDKDNVADPLENGSFEHPYDVIQEGVDKAHLRPDIDITYVQQVTEVDDRYRETVEIAHDVTVWGAGTPIFGYGGKTFGGGELPINDGESRGPAFTMGERSRLTGMQVENTFKLLPYAIGLLNPFNYATVPVDGDDPAIYYTQRVGVYANYVDEFTIDNVIARNNSFGALLVGWRDFEPTVMNSTFTHNSSGGLVVEARGFLGGNFEANLSGNTYSFNAGLNGLADGLADMAGFDLFQNGASGEGLYVRAEGLHRATVTVSDSLAMFNRHDGIAVELTDNRHNDVLVSDVMAKFNGVGLPDAITQDEVDVPDWMPGLEWAANSGLFNANGDGVNVDIDARDGGDAMVRLNKVTALGNSDDGIEVDASAVTGNATVHASMIKGSLNGEDGVEIDADTEFGHATIVASDLTGNLNGEDGVELDADSESGPATILASDLVGNLNEVHGIELDADTDTGPAFIRLVNASANLNGEDGVNADTDTVNGTATVIVRDVSVNGNHDDGMELDAESEFGLATITATDVLAIKNVEDGVEIDATSEVGAATVAATGILAALNDDDGIDIDATTVTGPATIVATSLTGIGNEDDGVELSADTENGNATVVATLLKGSFNHNDGLDLDADAENGNATVVGTLLKGNFNENDGVDLDADTVNGNATVTGTGLAGSFNHADGIQVDADVDNTGNALVSINGAAGIMNQDNGVQVQATATTAATINGRRLLGALNSGAGVLAEATVSGSSSPASVELSQAIGLGNDGYGIFGHATTIDGNADVSISQAVGALNDNWAVYGRADTENGRADVDIAQALAAFNDNWGIYGTAGSQGGVSVVNIEQAVAIGNANWGIYGDADTVDGSASVEMMDLLSIGNENYGIYGSVQASGTGTASGTIRDAVSLLNDNYGVNLYVSGNAYGELEDIVSMFNANHGVRARVVGQTDASATLNVTGVAALWNDGNGLDLDVDTYGNGYAVANVSDILTMGNASKGLYADVLSANGSAHINLDRIAAVANEAQGIHGVVDAPNGLASADLDEVMAVFNGSTGIDIEVGSVVDTLTIDYGLSAFNGGDGLVAAVSAEGYASAAVNMFAAIGNAGQGVDVRVESETGSSAATLSSIFALANGGDGVKADVDAWQTASIDVSYVASLLNGENGINLDAYSEASPQTAYANVTGVTASWNGANGIQANIVSGDGEAWANFDWVNAMGNGGDGIDATVNAQWGSASANFRGVNAMFNQGGQDATTGIDLNVSGFFGASALFEGVNASWNQGDGISADLGGGFGAPVEAIFRFVNAIGNTGTGIDADLNAADGNAMAVFEYVNAMFNQGGDSGNTGIDLDEYGWFGADATFSFVNASANVGAGILAAITSGQGAIDLNMSEISAIANTGAGIVTMVDADIADAVASIVRFFLAGNGSTALEMSATAPTGHAENAMDWGVFVNNAGNMSLSANGSTATNSISDNIWQF